MPFSLKNIEVTFQRIINKVFAKQIGRNVVAYVANTLVKSEKIEDHVADLKEVLEVLKKFGIKLNPKKCVSGVAARKFLGS